MFRCPRLRHRAAVLLAVCAVLVLPTGCGRGEPESPTIPTETFIDVMVALRLAAVEGASSEEFEERREQILRDAGVTDSALVAYVRVWGDNPQRMAAIWDSVATRLRAAGADTRAR
jgi:hypothetical protein